MAGRDLRSRLALGAVVSAVTGLLAVATFAGEIVHEAHKHHTVAKGDPEQRDESDGRRHRYWQASQPERQRAAGQGACGDDCRASSGEGSDFLSHDLDQWMGVQFGRHGLCKRIPVYRQCAACGQFVGVRRRHDHRTRFAHFPMQQADGVLFAVIRAE